MPDEADYVTILPTHSPHKFLVVIMKWHSRDEEFIQGMVSRPLSSITASNLAQSWAAVNKLDVRL